MERVKFRTTSTTKGIIKDVFCRESDNIYKGKELFSIAMDQSELIVKSHIDGRIKKIYVSVGKTIKDTDILCDILTQEEADYKNSNIEKFDEESVNTFNSEFDINDLLSDEYISDQFENDYDDSFVDNILKEKTITDQIFKQKDTNNTIMSHYDDVVDKLTDEQISPSLSKVLISLRKELLSLLVFNKELSEKIEDFNKNEINNAKKEIEDINLKLNKYSQKNTMNIEKRITDIESNLSTEIKKLADRYNGLHSQITKAKNRTDEINSKVEEIILSLGIGYDDSNLIEKVKILDDGISSLKTKLNLIEENIDSKVINYDDVRIVAKIKNLSDTILNMKTKIDLIDVDLMGSKFDEKFEAFSKSQKNIKELLENKIITVNDDVEKIAIQLNNLEFKISQNLHSKDKNKNYDELFKAIEKITIKADKFDVQNEDIKKNIQHLLGTESKIKKIEDNIKSLPSLSSIEKTKEMINNLNDKINSSRESMTLGPLKQKIAHLEIQLKNIPSLAFLDKLEERINNLDSKLKQEKDKNIESKKEIIELKKIVNKLNKNIAISQKQKSTNSNDIMVHINKFEMEYSLTNLVQFYEENAFYINTLDSPVRIDFIFYKSIQQAIETTNLIKINNLTIPKFSSQKEEGITYKAISFKDKSLDEIYEKHDKVAKRTDKIGKVSITDKKYYNKIWDVFEKTSTAEVLIIFNSIQRKNTPENKSSLPVEFYIKSNINNDKIDKFLLELDKLISKPQLID
ncbi:biotin/lipoyl-containing protein [Spiroplasma endosymbiont of Aspidapion aeneum]|uniref:biotin/lipoyl-containing protein n=1 Tax=Spiroplasma endosymbiont of Aspidapion aeneum TaxID=3066276 RepID=UPI00313F11D9